MKPDKIPEHVQEFIDRSTLTSDYQGEWMKKPRDFGWFGDDKFFDTWALGPVIDQREPTILQKANGKAIIAMLNDAGFSEGDDYEVTRCNHWAVGYVKHLSFRAVDSDGTTSLIAHLIDGIYEYLENDYPILDDDLYSETEWDAAYESVEFFVDFETDLEGNEASDVVQAIFDDVTENGLDCDDDGSLSWKLMTESLHELGYATKYEDD